MTGHVASLHLHPPTAGQPMRSVESVELVAGKGVAENSRYFGRLPATARPRNARSR